MILIPIITSKDFDCVSKDPVENEEDCTNINTDRIMQGCYKLLVS